MFDYPGIRIGVFHLHMFNAPAFVSVFILVVLAFLNVIFLLEKYPEIEKTKQEGIDENYNNIITWLIFVICELSRY